MLNRNKKTKITGRDRFQHRQFTQKLDQARNFKRRARYIPEHPVDLLLSRFGLGSRLVQILAGIVILGAVYLIYVPNFLSVNQISVSGLSETNRVIAEGAAKQSLSEAFFLDPQHNMIFLNQARLAESVARVPSVYEVKKITKDFKTNSVIIEVAPKVERFLVSDTERVYDVYNDGTLKAVAGLGKDEWASVQNPSMLKVQLPAAVAAKEQEQFFSEQMVQVMETINAALADIPNSPLSHFAAGNVATKKVLKEDGSTSLETGPLEFPVASGEIRAVLKKNNSDQTFAVIFDSQGNIKDAMKRLQLLLAQTAPDRYNNLNYIDMRLENRSYICLNGAPCVQ